MAHAMGNPADEAIQRFGLEALDTCAELFVATFNGPPWHDAWRPDQARAYLEDIVRSPGFMGFLLTVADRPVAFCVGRVNRWYQGDEYMVHEFGVRPEAQRRGYGTRLLASVESAAAAAGCRAIVLLTRRDLPTAAFYAAHGFNVSPHIALFYKALA